MRPTQCISLTDIFAKITEGCIAKRVAQDIKVPVDSNHFGNIPYLFH